MQELYSQNQLKLANKIIYNYNYNAGSEHLVHQIFQYLEFCNVEILINFSTILLHLKIQE